jgi:uncharacterized membrane protein
MTDRAPRRTGLIGRLHHALRHRPGTLAGVATAGLTGAVASHLLAPLDGWLAGWVAGALVYMAISLVRMTHSTPHSIRKRAALLDESRAAALAIAMLAAVIALFAVLVDLADARVSFSRSVDVGIAIAAIAVSWFFIHLVFTQHYAHEYYMQRLGLVFPQTAEPGFWDFIYFAFVIGMTYQVSDVSVSSTHLRKIIIAHGLLSFVFMWVILALVISFAAGLAS